MIRPETNKQLLHHEYSWQDRMSHAIPVLRDHLPALAAGLITLLVFAWLVTYGTWRFFDQEDFGVFYDAQMSNLIRGRMTVPYDAVGGEAFIVDGKIYGYYGIAPAIMRLPLKLIPGTYGRWSRTFVIVGCLMNLLCAYGIARTIGRMVHGQNAPKMNWLYALFLLAVGLGSTNIFMASRAYVYHEAIILANSFALLCYFSALNYLVRPTNLALYGAAIGCAVSVLTKPTAGLGALIVLGILGALIGLRAVYQLVPSYKSSKALSSVPTSLDLTLRQIGIVAGTIALTMSLYMAVNYARFGTLLDGVPLRYHSQFINNPERLARIQGSEYQPTNIPFMIFYYFSFDNVVFNDRFPWVYMRTDDFSRFPKAIIDGLEPTGSLPGTMPALTILSIIGIVYIFRTPILSTNMTPLLLGAFLAGGTILIVCSITHRYLHEFFPLLVMSSAAAIHAIAKFSLPYRRLAGALLVPLVFISIYVNLSLSIVYQRELVWGVPESTRQEFQTFRGEIDQAIDNLFS